MDELAKVMIVEDDVSLLEGISDLLEVSDVGYELQVLKATDGKRCLEILEEDIPDLIISDIMMPRMGGFELLSRLREQNKWVQIPVIFLTARGSLKDIYEGRTSGAELYITKPFDRQELVQLVRSQLDRIFSVKDIQKRRKESFGRRIARLLNHEFRTPLTYVTAYQQMLAEDLQLGGRENILEYLRGIRNGVIRLGHLIEDLTAVMEFRSGVKAERYAQNTRQIDDLGKVLRKACEDCRQEHEDKQPHILCDIPESLPPVFGDAAALYDVCYRLLDNAIKFSHDKPRISVTAGVEADELFWQVSDEGIGIPEGQQSRIFDLLHQIDREEWEQQGVGVGLTIAKNWIDLHEGRIELSSKEGLGSTFKIRLPIHRPGERLRSARQNGRGVEHKATILVVEDEWYLLEGLRDLLLVLETGYQLEVLTASNGSEALDVMSRKVPDLIISDIMMPQLNGYQLLESVRKNPEWVPVPFIFLTAKSAREDIVQGLRSGVEEYVTKPYDARELVEIIKSQLNRHFEKQGVIQRDFDDLKKIVLNQLLIEFQDPLSRLASYTEMLTAGVREAKTEKELEKQLKGLREGSEQVAKLVQDFIFVAEYQIGEAADNFKLRARPLNALDIVRAIEESLDNALAKSLDSIVVAAGTEALTIRSELSALVDCIERLAQIILTYSLNGLFYIRFSACSEKLCLRIGTNEVKLSQGEIEQIHQLLAAQELNLPKLAAIAPTLVFAKGIIALHGGKIVLQSAGNIGSEFVLVLPGIIEGDGHNVR